MFVFSFLNPHWLLHIRKENCRVYTKSAWPLNPLKDNGMGTSLYALHEKFSLLEWDMEGRVYCISREYIPSLHWENLIITWKTPSNATWKKSFQLWFRWKCLNTCPPINTTTLTPSRPWHVCHGMANCMGHKPKIFRKVNTNRKRIAPWRTINLVVYVGLRLTNSECRHI